MLLLSAHLGFWDWLVIAAASAMGTAIAYLPKPEQKAFVVMLPVPFTLSALALGHPIDASNVLGICLVLAFTATVWALHCRAGLPILLAIVAAATGYVGISWAIAQQQPTGDQLFWISAAFAITLGALLIRWLPHRDEPDSRATLPVWLKLIAIASVTTGILLLKQRLGGFVTTFPLVGVVAAYEARHCLWTMVRRMPWVVVMMTGMMIACRLTQDRFGLVIGLAAGWAVMVTSLNWFQFHYSERSAN